MHYVFCVLPSSIWQFNSVEYRYIIDKKRLATKGESSKQDKFESEEEILYEQVLQLKRFRSWTTKAAQGPRREPYVWGMTGGVF